MGGEGRGDNRQTDRQRPVIVSVQVPQGSPVVTEALASIVFEGMALDPPGLSCFPVGKMAQQCLPCIPLGALSKQTLSTFPHPPLFRSALLWWGNMIPLGTSPWPSWTPVPCTGPGNWEEGLPSQCKGKRVIASGVLFLDFPSQCASQPASVASALSKCQVSNPIHTSPQAPLPAFILQ